MTVLAFPKLREIPDGYISGPDLAAAAEISYRQLDHWTRTGHLHPVEPSPGSGHARAYPATDLARARLVRRLLNGGMNPTPAFALADELLEHGHTLLAGIRIELPQDL